MSTFKKDCISTIGELYSKINEYNVVENSIKHPFKCTVIASFIKQLEFLDEIGKSKNAETIFFLMPVIRGTCEDLIALTYINRTFKRKKNLAISLLIHQENYRKLKAQKEFFEEYKNDQIVLTSDIYSSYKQIRKEIQGLFNSYGINSGKLPPVESMANVTGYKSLYDFIYTGTSDLVHFRTGILLRMGWSITKEDHDTMKFSTKNFVDYYLDYLLYYSAFLFVEFAKSFKQVIGLKKENWNLIKNLEMNIKEKHRYPELVTFEELNIKRPSGIIEALMRAEKKRHIAPL